MAKMWLAYYNGSTTFVQAFNATASYDRDENTLEIGRTLRQVEYAHQLSHRRIYEITISADELATPANYAFMRAFWNASQWWLSLRSDATTPAFGSANNPDTEFVSVRIDGGLSPVEFINGHKLLPSFTLTLTERFPR